MSVPPRNNIKGPITIIGLTQNVIASLRRRRGNPVFPVAAFLDYFAALAMTSVMRKSYISFIEEIYFGFSDRVNKNHQPHPHRADQKQKAGEGRSNQNTPKQGALFHGFDQHLVRALRF
ncbi:MAG: hypothetical protein ACKO43_02800 [Alphaproteobacteria bacterium]